MANYFPVYLDISTGSIKNTNNTYVLNPINFPTTRSVAATSNSFATLLPDPYLIQTQSSDVSIAVNGASSSVMTFSLPTRQEKYYYASEAILAVSSTSASRTGPRISIQRSNVGDGFFTIKSATSLTAISLINQGSADNMATASVATVVANNTPVPVGVKGIFLNSTTQGTFSNNIMVQTSASINVTSRSGSLFYNHFIGFSSSIAPISSSRAPIALINGTLDSIAGGDLVTQSVLLPTQSLWTTSSLSGSTITNTSNTTWVTVFTLTGMTDNKRYLVNYFLRCTSDATTTGVWLRAASGSNHTGFLYSQPSGNNSVDIASSSGSALIENRIPTGVPSANSPRIYYGEYTVTKTAGQNPTIEIMSEVNASQVLAQSGSFVMWRLLE